MNILEGVSNNYTIDKDRVVACSSTDEEDNNVVRCKFKFSSNIVIKLEIERTFLHKYNSGDQLQVILGKLNEKYYELKPAFTPDPNIQILENARDIAGTAPATAWKDVTFDLDVRDELNTVYQYGINRAERARERIETIPTKNESKEDEEKRLSRNKKAREKRAAKKAEEAEELKRKLIQGDSIDRFADILGEE